MPAARPRHTPHPPSRFRPLLLLLLTHSRVSPPCPVPRAPGQVLHPSAMQPCIEGNIPIYVRDVFNPQLAGTVIEGRACSLSEICAKPDEILSRTRIDPLDPPIKGITSINKVAIVTVEGTGTSAVPDLVDRLFASLRGAGISPLMHTQVTYPHTQTRSHLPRSTLALPSPFPRPAPTRVSPPTRRAT